jgi:acetyl-CoA carboxylase biotin carboxyl carrier protein
MSEDYGSLLDPLLKIMQKHDLAEVEIERDGTAIRLKKHQAVRNEIVTVAAPGAAPAPAQTGGGSASGTGEKAGERAGFYTVKSPMVGTFYRAPNPESPSFTDVGERVDSDQTVCLIEAMKCFNEIKAEVDGVVEEILAENGQAVEFGQPLLRIKPNN